MVGRSTGTARLAALTALVGLFSAGWSGAAHAQEVEVEGIGYTLGNEGALVEVVEFGDFACSACAEFWRDTWPRVHDELVLTGRVHWRHVPFLLGFDRGEEATNAAECAADQGAFWEMHDVLYERQREWARGGGLDDKLRGYAVELGLDEAAFEECYDDEHGEDRTEAATRAADRAGVRGTPTFFINGAPALGALSFDQFLQVIDLAEELAREASGGA